jgi:hypothetical protein
MGDRQDCGAIGCRLNSLPIQVFDALLPCAEYKGVLELTPHLGIRPIHFVSKRRCMVIAFFYAVMRYTTKLQLDVLLRLG